MRWWSRAKVARCWSTHRLIDPPMAARFEVGEGGAFPTLHCGGSPTFAGVEPIWRRCATCRMCGRRATCVCRADGRRNPPGFALRVIGFILSGAPHPFTLPVHRRFSGARFYARADRCPGRRGRFRIGPRACRGGQRRCRLAAHAVGRGRSRGRAAPWASAHRHGDIPGRAPLSEIAARRLHP